MAGRAPPKSSTGRVLGLGDRMKSLRWHILSLVRPKATGDPASPKLQRVPSSLDMKTRESINFRNPMLLRATCTFHVLRSFGALFQSKAGTAKTYELSKPVGAIDVFISHVWSTDRFQKYLALTLYFNLSDALLAAVLGAAAAAVLTASGVLPVFVYHPELNVGHISIASRITGFVMFLLTLFLEHEVKGRVGCGGLRLFVDKAVIHQTDMELQREGIRHLAAFLAHSNRMVIIYTPETYLKRLWTVYELASMLVLKPSDRIEPLPIFLPKLVLGSCTACLLCSLMHSIVCTRPVWGLFDTAFPPYNGDILSSTVYGIPYAPIFLLHRHWERQCQQMWKGIEHFSIQCTECACEEDRPLVFGNIAAFMRDFRLTGPGMSDAEALEDFNELVRLHLPTALSFFGGHTAVPYRYFFVMWLAKILHVADDVAVGILDGEVRPTCIWAVWHATVGLGFLPCLYMGCQWAASEKGLALSAIKALVTISLGFALLTIQRQLAWRSEVSDGWLLAYLGMTTAYFGVVATPFVLQRRAVVNRRQPAR